MKTVVCVQTCLAKIFINKVNVLVLVNVLVPATNRHIPRRQKSVSSGLNLEAVFFFQAC